MLRCFLLFIFLVPAFLNSREAVAGVSVVQALHFGSFVVKSNDAQYDIVVNTDGSYSFDPDGYIEISPPQEGVFDIDGLPTNSVINSVVITQTTPLSGIGGSFQMLDFQELHTNTDGLGVATITIGATARSSGSGIAYADDTYSGELLVEINF